MPLSLWRQIESLQTSQSKKYPVEVSEDLLKSIDSL